MNKSIKFPIDAINQSDLRDAFKHASDMVEVDLNPNDFKYEYYLRYPIRDLYQFDDIDAWVEFEPGELARADNVDMRNELDSFRDMAPEWIKKGEIPSSSPIIVINAKEGSVIGDGRGRVSVAIGMGWRSIPTIIATEKRRRKKKTNLHVEESRIRNKGSLVVVDVQPEYMNVIGFDIYGFCEYLNVVCESRPVAILYNGYDTLGMSNESELKEWFSEYGFEYAFSVEYYDKGYGFFRFCMNSGVSDDSIIKLLRFMQKNNVTDSRQITEDKLWYKFTKLYSKSSVDDIREMLEFSDDMINIPDVMNWLLQWKSYHPGMIELCGSSTSECLAEVQLALDANKQKYKINNIWTYP